MGFTVPSRSPLEILFPKDFGVYRTPFLSLQVTGAQVHNFP
jgi:hypothetical protein